jgi:hypothetical protein
LISYLPIRQVGKEKKVAGRLMREAAYKNNDAIGNIYPSEMNEKTHLKVQDLPEPHTY